MSGRKYVDKEGKSVRTVSRHGEKKDVCEVMKERWMTT